MAFRIFLFIILTISSSALAADPPIQAYNGGSLLGTIFKINCDGNCITCTKTGITLNINFAASCSGGGAIYLKDDSSNNVADDASTLIIP